jgi:hypothetical protein
MQHMRGDGGMTDAPEKIWTTGNERTGSWNAEEVRMKAHMPDGWQTEYTRSDIADTLRAEVERLRAAIEPFADVSDFLASETEGLSDDDVFNLKLAGSKLLLMTYTAKQFHEARAALAHGEAD